MSSTPVNNYSAMQEPEENLLGNLLYKFLPWWPLFVLLLVMGLTGAWLYLRYSTPLYQSTATILVKDEKKGLDESQLLQSFDLLGSKKIVENEIEVIHSRTLAREVVRHLQLYVPITENGRVADRSAYRLSPVRIEAAQPDSIEPAEKVFFTYRSAPQPSVKIKETSYPLNEWVNTPYGVLKFFPNPNYAPPAEPRPLYFSLVPVNTVANDLLEELKVNASSKMATVINLEIKDEVPLRGESILDEWIESYNRAAIRDKNQLAANTLNFVDERLKFVVQELDSVERSLQRYKTQNKIVDISEQGRQFLESVGYNDKKVSEINVQLSALDQVEQYVQSKNGRGIVPSTFGIADPVLNSLLQKLYDAEVQYEKLRNTTGENDPVMIAVIEQMNRAKPAILENIRSQRRSLEAGRGDIYSSNAQYASILQSIPIKERELLEISRQQGIKNNIYTFLLQKREETALSYGSTVADTRIVDAASSTDKPVSPKPPLIFLIGVVAAMALGVGGLSAKEMLTRTVQTRDEIEKLTDTPILGEVMHTRLEDPIVVGEGKRTVIAEQFRHIRTSLGYLGINNRKKKILVTSSIPGEGKSFVASNLAVSLALMGKKVVMIELDLRKPRLSENFGVDRSVGVTHFLIEQKEPVEIIRRTSVNNLFIIPSGPIPPNPSELLLNGRMQELFTYLESQFDYILVDTAPVGPVTDAYILSPLCDATLYLVRQGRTPRVFLQKLKEGNRLNTLKNIALVYNDVKARGFGYYGYGYGDGYGYGYGYGYADDEGEKKGLFGKWKKKGKAKVG